MTQFSSRWFINWLIKTNDVPLTIETIEGRLIDTLSLRGIHYKDKDGHEVFLDKLLFDWSPVELFSDNAQIHRIELDGLTFRSTSDSSKETTEFPALTLPSIPFAVNVDELNITNVHIIINGDEQNIQAIKSSLSINETGLAFNLNELISDQQHLNGHVGIGSSKSAEIDAAINWQGELEHEAGQATLTIKGQQNNLLVVLDLNSVIDAKLSGNINLKDKPYRAELQGEIDEKIFEQYSDQLVLDAPILFSIDGDIHHISAIVDSHAQLISGEGFALKLETDAVIPTAKDKSININLNWQTLADVADNVFLSLKGQTDLKYIDQVLHIDNELQAPAVINLQGNVNFATESVDLAMQWDKFTIAAKENKINFGTGLLEASGKLDAMAVTLDTEFRVSNEADTNNKSYNKLSAKGEVNLSGEYPAGELNGRLKVAVPENIQTYIDSVAAINFVLSSEAGALKVNANTELQSEQLGPIRLDLIALWKDSVLSLESMNADVLEGKLNANGALDLHDKTNGSFQIKGSHLNIGVINPDLASQLDLNADISLSQTEKNLSAEIDITSLSGKWRGFPLVGSARLAYADDAYRIEKLKLTSGSNAIALNLNIDKLLSGFVELSIQDLSLFSSELAGAIEGRMEISGNIDTPNIDGKLNGKNIFINDIRLASFSADSNIDLRPQQHSAVKLDLTSLSYQGYIFDEVLIKGEGLTESHKFEITTTGKELNVNTLVEAGLNNRIWSGQIAQLQLTNKDAGLWQISSPSRYSWQVSDNAFELQKTCLFQNEAHLCINANAKTANDINGDVVVDSLPLKFIEPLLHEAMLLQGNVSGDVKFHLLDDNWVLQAGLESNDTRVGTQYDDEPEFIDIDVASLNLNVDKKIRELDIKLRSKKYFDISLTGSMQEKGTRALNGKLDLVFDDIKWLQNIEPTLSGSYGKFQAKMNVGGTSQQPLIDGTFSLHNGLLNVIPIGLALDKINGKVQSSDAISQVQLNAIFASKEKQLSLNGHVSLASEKMYPYEFNLKGESFPIMRTADVTMDVSPDIKLSGTKDLHYIRGQLTVPLLDMLISSLPESAVSLSPDVVIIQSKKADAVHIDNDNSGNDFVKNNIDLDVNVFLKPDIHIKGLGLDTRLTGDIKITKPVGLYQPRGEGQVILADGSYKAYGQDLVIESGRLLFAGPLDNPGISLRAYRPKLDVKAGVRISGDARQPKLKLFSEPAQSEADTLSYLITGGPISGASGGEASLIAQAALSLGTQESSVLTKQIRDMFGLDDFSVGGGNTVASTSVSASKRLTPKLTFKSSFNPFEQLWAFFLNYKLTDNWSVQTESGATQGADIVYSVESNTFSDLYKRFLDIIKF